MALIIENASVDNDLPKSRQSANTLFHFMTELKYLESILMKRKLYPRYCKETYTFMDKGFPSLIYPMKCFCDIHLEKIYLHCDDYGSFGIGFYKKLFIKKNIQPVQYINSDSSICKEYNNLSLDYIERNGGSVSAEFFDDELFKQLKFSKPLMGKIVSNQKGEYEKFFTDEQEWRYVPDFKQFKKNSPFLDPISDSKIIKNKSNQIETEDELYLDFNYEEIKYLLVDNTTSAELLIEFIYSDLKDVKEQDRLKLISKIIVLNDLMEDM